MPDTWIRNAVTEALGVFTLCFIGILAISSGNDLTGIALAHGLAIGVMVAALGHVSGGHFNPAITLGLLLGRKIDAPMAGVYWAAQLLGGVLAAVVVALTAPTGREAVAIGTPVLADDVNVLVGIVLEMIATFFLVLVVYGTVVDRRAPASVYPFAIGLTITIGILAIGAYTGGALNPARGFGPALVSGEWGGTLAWLMGPLLGGVAAWALHTYVLMPREEPESIAESGRREQV
jgi:MIP family channel proteins